MKILYSFLCILLIVVSLPLMAVFWVGGFIFALLVTAACGGFNAFMYHEDKE